MKKNKARQTHRHSSNMVRENFLKKWQLGKDLKKVTEEYPRERKLCTLALREIGLIFVHLSKRREATKAGAGE
jgi:hypothetical protein